MVNYYYDGSFEGLLTVLYEAFKNREKPNIINKEELVQQNFLYENKTVYTDIKKVDVVVSAIRNKISDEAFMNIFYVYLSQLENYEIIIYDYLSLGWRISHKISLYLSDDRVLKVEKICQKVLGERHRMLGLVRFKLLKGQILYSRIEPDYNISVLLAPHFCERLKCENWIIHDAKRDIGVLYNKKINSSNSLSLSGNDWIVIPFYLDSIPEIESCEIDYEALWRQYTTSIAIQSRKNEKLQRKNMPFRYWKNLTEMMEH